jgi:hypothetical protein
MNNSTPTPVSVVDVPVQENTTSEVLSESTGSEGIAIGIIVGIIVVYLVCFVLLIVFGLKTRTTCATGLVQNPTIAVALIISIVLMFTPLSPAASTATLVLIILGSNICS